MATSPYVGAYIYQNDSLWLYDVQFLKTYLDNNPEYDRTRWQAGVTRTFPFTYDSKSGNTKLRLGYRNDNWHYPSISHPALADPEYKGMSAKVKSGMKSGSVHRRIINILRI